MALLRETFACDLKKTYFKKTKQTKKPKQEHNLKNELNVKLLAQIEQLKLNEVGTFDPKHKFDSLCVGQENN